MKLRKSFIPLLASVFLIGCDKPAETEETSAPAAPSAPYPPATPEAQTPPPVEEVVTEEASVTLEPEPAATTLPDPVAKVNGTPISREEFEKTLQDIFASMGMQPDMLPPDQRSMLYRQFAEDMVIDKLIDQASASTEVAPAEVDEEIAKIAEQYGTQERFAEELAASGQNLDEFRERLTKLIRQRKWMESQVGSDEAVTEADAKKFYDENLPEFAQPEVVRASHILIRVEPEADEETVQAKLEEVKAIGVRIADGEDFGKLAEEVSEDPTAKQNAGDLNFFPRDRMVPEFAEVAFDQEINTVSEPVRTEFGWHLIKVTDKKDAQTLPFDEVKADIAEYLEEGKQQEAVDQVIQELRSSADVEILIPEPTLSGFPGVPENGGPTGN